jgi:putative intracellular protease/amidase
MRHGEVLRERQRPFRGNSLRIIEAEMSDRQQDLPPVPGMDPIDPSASARRSSSPAGRGRCSPFEGATDLHRRFVEFYEAGKIACALCHGTAIQRYARLSNGEYLAKGKTVTGFANVEEDFADNAVWSTNLLSRGTHVTPWRIEDELKKLGANYIQAGLWRGFATRDGNLITGQQNFSGGETAEMLVRALGE